MSNRNRDPDLACQFMHPLTQAISENSPEQAAQTAGLPHVADICNSSRFDPRFGSVPILLVFRVAASLKALPACGSPAAIRSISWKLALFVMSVPRYVIESRSTVPRRS